MEENKNRFRHVYIVSLLLSCVLISGMGLYYLPDSELGYTEIPALAAVAINNLEQQHAEEDQGMIDIDALKKTGDEEDTEEAAPEGEEVETEEEDDRMALIDEAIERMKENAGVKPSTGERPPKTGKYPHVSDSEARTEGDDYEEEEYKFTSVGANYFYDALFIGDSREQGFGMYSQLDKITVYAERGYHIYTASTRPVVDTPFGKITLTDALALSQHQYKKVYIMFGINELAGGSNQDLSPYFYNLIDYIKLMQPGSVIYLQSIIHVTANTAKNRPALSNERIDKTNEMLKKVAADEKIVYLDLNEIFTDEDGALFADAAGDGIHLNSDYILKWRDYLMTHAIVNKNTNSSRRTRRESEDGDDVSSADDIETEKEDPYSASKYNGLYDPDMEYGDYDEDGYPFVKLNEAQQQLRDQLDKYYRSLAEQQDATELSSETNTTEETTDQPEGAW